MFFSLRTETFKCIFRKPQCLVDQSPSFLGYLCFNWNQLPSQTAFILKPSLSIGSCWFSTSFLIQVLTFIMLLLCARHCAEQCMHLAHCVKKTCLLGKACLLVLFVSKNYHQLCSVQTPLGHWSVRLPIKAPQSDSTFPVILFLLLLLRQPHLGV